MNFLPKLESFEGPLDLLLHLIEKNEIDIYDIPISEITDQYMEYLDAAQDTDTDFLSDFLVMAATLLEIKAKLLIPVQEDSPEEDPREALVNQLLEYKLYKYMSLKLKDQEISTGHVVARAGSVPKEVLEAASPVDYDLLLKDVTLQKLCDIFKDAIKRYESYENEDAKHYGKIKKEEIPLPLKMDEIRFYLKKNHAASFERLVNKQPTRENLIVTFLAVLELMKTGEICAEQKKDDIELIWTGQN